jgi:hypothetical protein
MLYIVYPIFGRVKGGNGNAAIASGYVTYRIVWVVSLLFKPPPHFLKVH